MHRTNLITSFCTFMFLSIM